MAMATTAGTLSDSEHSAQLRKAVIASTVGTAIEWYDFFLYGTAAGLVFGKLYFPNQDPLSATLLAFGTYFIGFVGTANRRGDFRPLRRSHWPQGDADRHAVVHGSCDLRHRLCTDLRGHRHLGRDYADRPADDPRHWRRRRVGRFGAAGDGMVAHAEPTRARGGLAAIRRALRACCCRTFAVPCFQLPGPATDFLTWGWRVPFALSIILVGVGLWIRLGILETPVFQKLLDEDKVEKAPILEVIKKQPKEIILSALLRMSEQAPFYVFTAFVFAYAVGTLKMDRNFILQCGDGGGLRVVLHHPALRSHLR